MAKTVKKARKVTKAKKKKVAKAKTVKRKAKKTVRGAKAGARTSSKTTVKKSVKAKRPTAKTQKTVAKKAASRPKAETTRAPRPAKPSVAPGKFLEKSPVLINLPNAASAAPAAVALRPTLAQAVTRCVNDYLQSVEPEWNDDGGGNDKTLGDLHVHVALFLAGVAECLEKFGYTFDATSLGQTVHSDTTVSEAKQEIRDAAGPVKGATK
ncbi:hypothetical protein [Tardiphaga robiniae]|uniref:hypothetical protein n=1 Tax=Tardiphaga robiniae TaxID=943830 RepID=UPI001111A3D9|nr:hypothetical protein [Tardiphaga robiniae]